jgi:hypothetical protein
MWAAPPFATVAVFVCYQLVGHPMNEKSLPALFTALMLFNNLRFPRALAPPTLARPTTPSSEASSEAHVGPHRLLVGPSLSPCLSERTRAGQ